MKATAKDSYALPWFSAALSIWSCPECSGAFTVRYRDGSGSNVVWGDCENGHSFTVVTINGPQANGVPLKLHKSAYDDNNTLAASAMISYLSQGIAVALVDLGLVHRTHKWEMSRLLNGIVETYFRGKSGGE